MKKNLLFVLIVLFTAGLLIYIGSCTKVREDRIQYFKDHLTCAADTNNDVVVNEFVARGSTLVSELSGVGEDWVELYNPRADTVDFSRTPYFITDDSTWKGKFVINRLSIPPKGFMIIFCDDSNQVHGNQIHTSFGLSKNGEFVGLFKYVEGDTITLTSHAFPAQQPNVSEGRYPDACPNWTNFPTPTPGTPNHL